MGHRHSISGDSLQPIRWLGDPKTVGVAPSAFEGMGFRGRGLWRTANQTHNLHPNSKGAADDHPPTAPSRSRHRRHQAAGFTTPGASPASTAGSGFDRNGPSTLRALAHAVISSASSPNR